MNYAAIISDALATGRNGFQQHVCPHSKGYLRTLWLASWREGHREYKRLAKERRSREFAGEMPSRERIA